MTSESTVLLSEEDYVCAKLGNRREDYDPALAQKTKLGIQEALGLVRARGGSVADPVLMLSILREIMFERYEAERGKVLA